MSHEKLRYLSEFKLQELRRDVEKNLPRYTAGDFADLAGENGWAVDSSLVTMDIDQLALLDGDAKGANAEIENSCIVHSALKGMTPSLAQEERIWARLAHIECIEFTRRRWLKGDDTEKLQTAVNKHFFAMGRTGCRDDNAISRLWWNYHVATIARPDDPTSALRVILEKADTRLNLLERTGIGSRAILLGSIITAVETESWLTDQEDRFREFMKVLNREGGGILFETLPATEVHDFVMSCVSQVRDEALEDV